MNKKLYVGGLNYAVDDESLKALFATVGHVESSRVITEHPSGRSKGFGFVEMSSSEEANTAIEKLNGTTHEGRTITVSIARPPQEGGRGGNRGGNGSGGFRDRQNYGGGHDDRY